ncbi:MAG: N-acetylmuramoyl-L-alanine amidase [Spirochaetes bacterium]|nr:MAG: N-acetylmuramoyl-L-alanine amidase [Spirochaetota bacterium]
MRKSGKVYAAFIIILFLPRSLFSEHNISIPVLNIDGKDYVSLHALSAGTASDASLDLVTQRGKLFRGTHVTVFQPGMTILLVDGRLSRSPYPVRRREGEILLPEKAAREIILSFFPGRTCTRTRNSLECALPPEKNGRQADESGVPVRTTPDRHNDRIAFIILDPGHGGRDPGAIGKGGVQEKGITLSVTRKLEKLMRANFKGIRVVLTRSSDTFLELGRRTEIANSHLKNGENGIFVSVHVNASVSPRISGYETYFLSQNPSNEEARATSALENNVVILEEKKPGSGRDDAEHMEAMMLTTQIQKESSMLAETMQAELARLLTDHKARGVRKADFFVLRGSLMPAILVEIGFITNSAERASLQKDAYQDRVAEALYHGVAAFLKKYNSGSKNK